MKKTLTAILIFATFHAFSQFTLTNKEYSPYDIVTRILLDSAENFNVRNIAYQGSPYALGVFQCTMEYNKDFIKRGIILSTGYAADAKGPNSFGNKTSYTAQNSDSDLEILAQGKTFDAATLSFDFTATGDSLSFNFIFASEEYPEFVGQSVNDVFGFFVTDLTDNKKINIAYLPNSVTPITVDNVNEEKNSEFFFNNPPVYLRSTDEWKQRKEEAERAYTFEYDGLTKLLRASMKTISGHTYHIKIAIADIGDRKYDSAIMLEAHSFKTVMPVSENSLALVKTLFNVSDKNADSVVVSYNIQFGVDNATISDTKDIAQLDKIVSLLRNSPKLKIAVNGHTDGSGTAEHNWQLSVARAKSVADYFQSKGIDTSRISYQGFGSSKPISDDKSKNRRVDFIFR